MSGPGSSVTSHPVHKKQSVQARDVGSENRFGPCAGVRSIPTSCLRLALVNTSYSPLICAGLAVAVPALGFRSLTVKHVAPGTCCGPWMAGCQSFLHFCQCPFIWMLIQARLV